MGNDPEGSRPGLGFILSAFEAKFEHENWLEKLRSGKNEFVFDQKVMKFGFKTDLGWTWGVNSPTFEGPTLFEGHLGSEIFSFEHENLTRKFKVG